VTPNPHPSIKPHKFDVLVKVGITAEDHLGLSWLAQTAGMTRSGFVRCLIRQRLEQNATPAHGAVATATSPEFES
jgi:hypothetical protein